MSGILWNRFEAAALRNPIRAAVIDAEGRLSYEALLSQTDALADAFAAQGIGKGSTLGIRVRDGRRFLATAFAAWRCGAAIVPISHQLVGCELEELFAVTPLDAVVEDVAPPTPGAAIDLLCCGKSLRFVRVARRNEASLHELVPGAAYMRFTSGTTGTSKGVIVTDRAIVERIAIANGALGIRTEDVVLCVLPMAFHFLVSVVLYAQVGATMVLCPELAADALLDAAKTHRATFLYASPLHVRLLASDESGRTLGGVRCVVSTSSALPTDVARAFRHRFRVPVAQGYGIIEAGLPLVNTRDSGVFPESVGRPSPGCEVEVLDAGGEPVPAGEIGELALHGPGMFSAYLKPFLRVEEVMSGGWFRTGDLAKRDADGRFTLCGRIKAVINMAGNKVFPEEVEQILDAHPAIAKSRVRGVPHARFGEAIAAEAVIRDGIEAPRAEEVLSYCRKRLSPYKVPATLSFVAEIAETASGKLRRA